MIAETDRYLVASQGSLGYWEDDFPRWAALNSFTAGRNAPLSIEPHYHDCDEFWLWLEGEGEVRLDWGPPIRMTPGTAVFTPMGSIHEFFSPTVQWNMGITTKLVGQKRATHILVHEAGEPVRTGEPFAVPAAQNTGPFPGPITRCPLQELRVVEVSGAQVLEDGVAAATEYWLVLSGASVLDVELDGDRFRLRDGDLAIVRKGTRRRLAASGSLKLALARESGIVPPGVVLED